MNRWLKWPKILIPVSIGSFGLWIVMPFVAPVFFYHMFGAKTYPDLVHYEVVVLYDCENHKKLRGHHTYAAKGNTKNCGLSNATLVFYDLFGFEVYRGQTDKSGIFIRPFSFEGYEDVARANSVVLVSNLCQSKKYSFEVRKELVMTGEWSVGTIGYQFSGYKRIDCELSLEGMKILKEKGCNPHSSWCPIDR